MPLYEFHCEKCQQTFDEIVPMGTVRHICKNCLTPAKKILSVSAFNMKPWHETQTDLARKAYTPWPGTKMSE